jgi:hypothetical protein
MCKLTLFLVRLVPFRFLRGAWLERHISRCPACREAKALDGSLGDLFLPIKTWADSEESLWPAVRGKIRERSSPKTDACPDAKPVTARRWAPACAALLLAAALMILVHRLPVDPIPAGEDPSAAGSPRIHVKYGSLGGEKAEPFIFQTDKASFVWYGTGRSGG